MAGEYKSFVRRSSSQARRASREMLAATQSIEPPIYSSEYGEEYGSYRKNRGQDDFETRAKARYTGKNKGKPSVSEKTRMRLPQIIFSFVLIALLASAGLFAWDRWFRHDDIQDFRGQWKLAGSPTPVVIDARSIKLIPEVSYVYDLDIWGKTVSYKFGDLQGFGKYRFSPDRQKLVIIEGTSDDWVLYAKIALGLAPVEEGAPPEETTILVRDASSIVGFGEPAFGEAENPVDGTVAGEDDGSAEDGQGTSGEMDADSVPEV